jgi:acid phosphatase family membrane protein YuiD
MELVISPYLIAGASGWVIAQGIKYIIATMKGRKLNNLRQLYLSGSMPSAHTATVIAVLVVIGFKDGVDSGLFGLATLFASVVMYDAIMVRRSSGEQGASLTELIKLLKSKVNVPRVAKGHTPSEVVGGVIVGLVIGVVVHFATVGL